jgi:ribosomal protein S18 acetylase RimI-like enzyme
VTRNSASFDVLPVAAPEWARLREIRLRSLADSPAAFASRLETERLHPDSVWRERAIPSSSRRMWSARAGDGWVGLTGTVRAERARFDLISMWVDPAWRRRGVARALIAAVVTWQRRSRGSELYLWVTPDNAAAQSCYETAGFRLTGSQLQLTPDPAGDRLEMRLEMSGLK